MSKKINMYTTENVKKNKRKSLLKNSTYALVITFGIILAATLIAVNTSMSTNSNHEASIETATHQTNYISPLTDAVIIKDYNSNELQYNDTLKQWEIHKAIDLTSEDNNVYAIMNGTVTNIYNNYLEGTVIEITHNNGFTSVYKSLDSKTEVTMGEVVKQGDVIAKMSSSMARELNSGNHLHFELLFNNEYVNPNEYIDFSNK